MYSQKTLEKYDAAKSSKEAFKKCSILSEANKFILKNNFYIAFSSINELLKIL